MISGDFGFEKTIVGTETKLLIGAANVNTFLGVPDRSLGVSVTDASLAMVMLQDSAIGTSTYALTATGNAELLGLDVLSVVGSLAVRVNNTGAAVNESIGVGTTGRRLTLYLTMAPISRRWPVQLTLISQILL